MTSRTVFAIVLFAAAAGFGLPGARVYAESANADFKQGQAAEAREDYDTAFDDFQKASNKDPRDARFKIALARVRVTASSVHVSNGRKLVQAGDTQGALANFFTPPRSIPATKPRSRRLPASARSRAKARRYPRWGFPSLPRKPRNSSPSSLRQSSSQSRTSRSPCIWPKTPRWCTRPWARPPASMSFSIPTITPSRIEVDLNNVSLLDALRIVGVMSNTFWRPVTSNTIFVAQNTPSKRRDLDEQAVQTFYLTNAWQQNDLNDVATAMRNVMPNAKVFPVQSQNAIVMRGTPDELLLAQQLIDDLDKPRGEVVVDIAVLEVSKNWEKTLGMQWPSSFGVTLQPNCAATNSCSSTTSSTTTGTTGTTSTVSPTLYNLAHLNSTDFAVTVGSATLNLLLTDNNTKVLQSPRIRATDAQKATMKIGSQDPHRHRLLSNRRGHGAGQLAGQHPVPVPGRGREYRDDAQHPLRPRRYAQDQDRRLRRERHRSPSAASPSPSSASAWSTRLSGCARARPASWAAFRTSRKR